MIQRANEKRNVESFTINCILDGLDDDAVCKAINNKFGGAKIDNVKWYRSKVKAVLNFISSNQQTTRRIYEVFRDSCEKENEEIIDLIYKLKISPGSEKYLIRNFNAFRSIESCIIARGDKLDS